MKVLVRLVLSNKYERNSYFTYAQGVLAKKSVVIVVILWLSHSFRGYISWGSATRTMNAMRMTHEVWRFCRLYVLISQRVEQHLIRASGYCRWRMRGYLGYWLVDCFRWVYNHSKLDVPRTQSSSCTAGEWNCIDWTKNQLFFFNRPYRRCVFHRSD